MSEQLHLTQQHEIEADQVINHSAFIDGTASYNQQVGNLAGELAKEEISQVGTTQANNEITSNNPDIAYDVAWAVKPSIESVAAKEHRLKNPVKPSLIDMQGRPVGPMDTPADIAKFRIMKRAAELDLNENIDRALKVVTENAGNIAVNNSLEEDRESPRLERQRANAPIVPERQPIATRERRPIPESERRPVAAERGERVPPTPAQLRDFGRSAMPQEERFYNRSRERY